MKAGAFFVGPLFSLSGRIRAVVARSKSNFQKKIQIEFRTGGLGVPAPIAPLAGGRAAQNVTPLRTPNTAASFSATVGRVPFGFATLPPGWKTYWANGCTLSHGVAAIW